MLFGINLGNTAKEVDFVFFPLNSEAESYVEIELLFLSVWYLG